MAKKTTAKTVAKKSTTTKTATKKTTAKPIVKDTTTSQEKEIILTDKDISVYTTYANGGAGIYSFSTCDINTLKDRDEGKLATTIVFPRYITKGGKKYKVDFLQTLEILMLYKKLKTVKIPDTLNKNCYLNVPKGVKIIKY